MLNILVCFMFKKKQNKNNNKKQSSGMVDGFPASTASISDFRITKPQKIFVCMRRGNQCKDRRRYGRWADAFLQNYREYGRKKNAAYSLTS